MASREQVGWDQIQASLFSESSMERLELSLLVIFCSPCRRERMSFCLRRWLREACWATTTATNSSTPPTNTQKDTPRYICTSMKQSPKRFSVTPTRQCPMATKQRSMSTSRSSTPAPHNSRTTITMSYTCTPAPTPITTKHRMPIHYSSWKMDWQKMSLERQTAAEMAEQDWYSLWVICLPQRRLMQSERQSETTRSVAGSLSTQKGISMRPQSQQDMEKTRMRKVSMLASDASSSRLRTMSCCFWVVASIRFCWLSPRFTYRNLFKYYIALNMSKQGRLPTEFVSKSCSLVPPEEWGKGVDNWGGIVCGYW